MAIKGPSSARHLINKLLMQKLQIRNSSSLCIMRLGSLYPNYILYVVLLDLKRLHGQNMFIILGLVYLSKSYMTLNLR